MDEQPHKITILTIVKEIYQKHKASFIFALDILLNLIIIGAMVLVIRTFLISPFQVFGPSMCDTLNNLSGSCEHGYGEYIIVNKAVYQNLLGWQVGLPKRGDIIVFRPPQNKDEFFIKRVIGLPGETVQIKNGAVNIINKENPTGFTLQEAYLNSDNKDNTHAIYNDKTIFEVPNGSYFVMGDNRVQSSDSRSCFKESPTSGGCGNADNTPFLPLGNIEGKAWVVLWPLNKISILGDPAYQTVP